MSSPRSPFDATMPKTVFGFGSSAPRYCNKPTVTPPPAKLTSSRSGRSPSPTMGATSSPSRMSPPRRLSSSPRRSFSPSQSQYESVHSPTPSAHLRSNAYSPSQSLVESLSRPLTSSRPAFGSTGPRLAPTTPSPIKPRLPYSRGTVVGSSRASPSQQPQHQYLRSSHSQSHSHSHSLDGSPRTVHSEEGEAYGHSHLEERDAYANTNNYENKNTEKNNNNNNNNNNNKSVDEDESPAQKLSLPEPSQPAVEVAKTVVVETQPTVTVAPVEPVVSPSQPAETTSEEPTPRSIVVYSNEDQEVKEERELDLSSSAHQALRQHITDFEVGVTLEEDLAEAVLSSLFRERRPFCAEEICECRAYKTDYKASSKEEVDEGSERSAFLAQLSVAGERAASALVIFDSRKPVIAVTQLRFDEEANNEVH